MDENPRTTDKPEKVTDKEDNERVEFLAAMEKDFTVQHTPRGECVSGTVVSVSKEYVFLNLGGKSEGILSVEEFDQKCLPEVGDTIEACVLSESADGVFLSQKLARGIRDRKFLSQAAHSHIPVQGRVVSRNKGGFDVEVVGVRAFCPVSQIEQNYCENLDEHIGKHYTFLITEYDASTKQPNVVVSRRAFLQVEREHAAFELKRTLNKGDIVSGTVRDIQSFGAFVDLGGLDGLLPMSELSWGRVENVSDILSIGEEIHVQVISFDRERTRITLSLKNLDPNPWDQVREQYTEKSRHKGKVVRLQPFGAFVELSPGVDGLIHISNLNTPERINHPKDVLRVGQEIEVEVLGVEPEKKRIALARVPREGEFGDIPVVGGIIEGKVESIAPFGVFVKLGPGRKGLIHNKELGIPKGADVRKDFPVGKRINVKILEVTDNRRRISLSARAVRETEERAEFESYLDKSKQSSSAFFGSLGDLIKNK